MTSELSHCNYDITWWSSYLEIAVISTDCRVMTITVWCIYDIRMKSLCDVIMISQSDHHTPRSLWYQSDVMWWLPWYGVYMILNSSYCLVIWWHHRLIIIPWDHFTIQEISFIDYHSVRYIWHQTEITVYFHNDITLWISCHEITVIADDCHVTTIAVSCTYDIRM